MCETCLFQEADIGGHFDPSGRCCYCLEADRRLPAFRYSEAEERENLEELTEKIKNSKRSGIYDCLIGLSGGVDSSYVAHLARVMKWNPLVVHFDNGWNSEIAVTNIKNIVQRCNFDLVTYVINWPEFRDLQRAFFKADVLDIEMLTDHAIYAAMFRLAKQHGIRTVLSGANYQTEHGIPDSWCWIKQDIKNIRAIQKRFGEKKIASFPVLSILQYAAIRSLHLGATFYKPLELVLYRKDTAMKILSEEYGWRYYGGKHFESTFTRYYQAHVLPTKFGIDKRKAHFSALIRNGEITREEALVKISTPLYDPQQLAEDTEFVAKKLGFSVAELTAILERPPVPHDFYPSDIKLARFLARVWNRFNG